jgi:integrative and conjugative element protein (TIGR02256 family)
VADLRHPYFDGTGPAVPPGSLAGSNARALAAYASLGLDEDVSLAECRRSDDGMESVLVRVRLYPPQRPAADIRQEEELAVLFTAEDRHPALLAARADFPETPHQNMMLEGLPKYPCVDDRPWDDAAPGWSPYAYLERVKWWLNAAAMGELSGTGQVVDPFFVAPGPDLLVPARVLADVKGELAFALVPPAGSGDRDVRCLHLVESGDMPIGQGGFKAIMLTAPVSMAKSVTTPPGNVEALLRVAQAAGLDLLRSIQTWIARLPAADLSCRPALLLNFPVAGPGSTEVRHDLVAFALKCDLGRLGTMLGVLSPDPERASSWGKLVVRAPVQLDLLAAERMLSMAVQLEFDLGTARPLSGVPDGSTTKALLVGAGAIGSHVALALTREGRHSWTVADGDWLRPHNLARHVLGQSQVGQFKARALAVMLSDLSRAQATPIVCDVLRPADQTKALEEAAAGADIILDASASIAVSRRMSDWGHAKARRVSAFFNPSGDAAVLLAEDAARSIPLDALEAQYYRLVLRDDALSAHLAPPPEGFRYAGSCRAVSARIPESRVSVLSGLAAAGISAALAEERATLCTWSLQPGGGVTAARVAPSASKRETLAGWTVLLDDDLAAEVRRRREEALPSETGGVLVGTVDMQRRVIAAVDALHPPADSSGDATTFTRGTGGLRDRLDAVARRTGGMVRYIGEWHTHPRGSEAMPSALDIEQLVALRRELRREGLPATMLISGSDGERFVALSDAS